MLSMFCAPSKPPVRLSPLFGHLTQELSAISGLDSLVNPDFVVINSKRLVNPPYLTASLSATVPA